MVLQRVCSKAEKDVEQTVVPHNCKKRLLVVEGVSANKLRCGVRYFYRHQLGARHDAVFPRQLEFIMRASGQPYVPLFALGLCSADRRREKCAETKAVKQIALVFWEFNSEFFCPILNFRALEFEFVHALLPVGEEDFLYNRAVAIFPLRRHVAHAHSLRLRYGRDVRLRYLERRNTLPPWRVSFQAELRRPIRSPHAVEPGANVAPLQFPLRQRALNAAERNSLSGGTRATS